MLTQRPRVTAVQASVSDVGLSKTQISIQQSLGAEARVLARILEELDLWLLLQPALGVTSLAGWSLGFAQGWPHPDHPGFTIIYRDDCLLERPHLPGLESLIFGDEFNQSLELPLPGALKTLTLGHEFNQSLDVELPEGLEELRVGHEFQGELRPLSHLQEISCQGVLVSARRKVERFFQGAREDQRGQSMKP